MIVFAYAMDGESFRAARQASGAKSWHFFPDAGTKRIVGYFELGHPSHRKALREYPGITILPSPGSMADITAHAAALGLTNAKTARDIYAAIFAATNADAFDPDL